MKIIDITKSLNEETETYEGDPRFIQQVVFDVAEDGFKLSNISMSTHAGTHTDAPSHFLPRGKSLGEIPLKNYIGRCTVADFSQADTIKAKRLLLKQGSKRLSLETAKKLIENGTRLIGVDSLSVGNDDVHKYLLENECIIIESLKLSRVENGFYTLFALPLKIDADGAPLRACLVVEE